VSVLASVFAQDQDADAFDRHERRELRQDSLSQAPQGAMVEKGRGGVDDDFQPTPRFRELLQLLIAA
jgi:hypothetical protein